MNILLMPNKFKDAGGVYTDKVLRELEKYDCTASVSPDISELSDAEIRTLCENNVDVAIVLGGDGSIIKAARSCADTNAVILGVNLGRVGYLAAVEPDATDELSRLFDGGFTTEKRMMLDVWVERDGMKCGDVHTALNEAVLSHGSVSRLVEMKVYCDGEFIDDIRADGLILSTPTGSTAYSMSAGGPIVDPSLSAIISVPICPYSLRTRSVIFSDKCEISVTNLCPGRARNGVALNLTIDGNELVELETSDVVRVRKSNKYAKFVKLDGAGSKSFYKKVCEI